MIDINDKIESISYRIEIICCCTYMFKLVHLPFAKLIKVINKVWMMLRTAFISPKLSPVPFITKLLAVKNRPEAKAITHPIILRPHSSKSLIRITDHNNFFLRNLKLSISIFVDLYFSYPFSLGCSYLFRFSSVNNSFLRISLHTNI